MNHCAAVVSHFYFLLRRIRHQSLRKQDFHFVNGARQTAGAISSFQIGYYLSAFLRSINADLDSRNRLRRPLRIDSTPVSSYLAVYPDSVSGRRQPAKVLKIFTGLGQRARPHANVGIKLIILLVRIGIDQITFATFESESAVAASHACDHFHRCPLGAEKSLLDRETNRSFLNLIFPILDVY